MLPVAPRTEVQMRNEKILNDLIEWKEQNPSMSLQSMFKKIAEKYNITFSNAQALYYTKFKTLFDDEVKPTTEYNDNLKEIIRLNKQEVRVVEHKDSLYIVAKDLLKSIGIGSISSHLNTLLEENDKTIVPVKSSHGYAKTLIVKIDTCLEFLNIVIDKHKSVQTRQKAENSLRDLKFFIESLKKDETSTSKTSNNRTNNSITPVKDLYRNGEKVEFLITHIGTKSVLGETKDGYKTPGMIYISDVANSYVKDLHDYFEKGKTVLAAVKHYDWQLNRLFLNTKETIKPINRNHNKEILQSAKPALSVTIREERENNDSHELTFYNENLPSIPEVSKTNQDDTPQLSIKAQVELEAIMDMINAEARIGALSPEAKRKLIELLNEKGLVKVITGIKDSVSEFKPDLGLLFLNEVEKKFGNGGL